MLRTALLAIALVLGTASMAAPAPDSGPSSSPSRPYPVDTVKCNDGTSGLRPIKASTCSGHGGVAAPASSVSNDDASGDASTPVATTPTSAPPKGATALCKDGTYSKSKTHSGTCSRHGGVGKWL